MVSKGILAMIEAIASIPVAIFPLLIFIQCISFSNFRENARLWSGHFHPGWRASVAHGTFCGLKVNIKI